MISIILIVYAIVSVSIVVSALRCRGGCLYYPFWATLTFSGFAIPQFISLANSKVYPGLSLEKYIIMATLCLGATYFGFKSGSKAVPAPRFEGFFSRKMEAVRLRWLSFFYTLIGGFFLVCLYSSGAKFASQVWAGPWVIYLFFSGFMIYGFVIAADLYLQKGYKRDMVLALSGVTYLLLRIVIHGRRSSAVLLFIVILSLLWFRRRKLIPVSLIVAVVVIGLVIAASMHEYRVTVADKLEFSKLTDIDFIDAFKKSYGEGQAPEVLNGCYVIETTDRTLAFDFGASHWNAAVWNFVPRQLVGEDFKQSLMLPFNVSEEIFHIFMYTKKTGSTLTGIADCYVALSYFGSAKFFIIAFILGVLYANAERGSTIAIILYLLLLHKGLTSFTHGTSAFSNSIIMLGIFLMPGLMPCSFRKSFVVQKLPDSSLRAFRWN
jgi:hypothetical protein